jgi:hypothetical protein
MTLDQPAIKIMAEQYLARLTSLVPGARHAIDKLPGNFYYVGLIHIIFPNATVIHTLRDPVDTCLSCFTSLFKTGNYYIYDLGELGRAYSRYRHLMEHWRHILPQDRMLDVQYEDVITDLEGQARRIIAHCGLPWDNKCLDFYRTQRQVRTASRTQVRQPVYTSAIGRWQGYEELLTPLLVELGISADRKS